MRSLLVGKRAVLGQQVDYFLLAEEAGEWEDYGVKIAISGGESAEIPHITVSDLRIMELLQLLIRGLVTPTGLADVLADWL